MILEPYRNDDEFFDAELQVHPSEDHRLQWLGAVEDGDDAAFQKVVIDHIRVVRTHIETTFEISLNMIELKYLADAVHTAVWQCILFEKNLSDRRSGEPLPQDAYQAPIEVAMNYWFQRAFGFDSVTIQRFHAGETKDAFAKYFRKQRDILNNEAE